MAATAALVVSAFHAQTTRAYAYSVPSITPLMTLKPGERICEGPLRPQEGFRTAVFMNSGATTNALVTVHAGGSAGAPTVAGGTLETITAAEGENAVLLTRRVSAASRLTLCVRERHGAMTLYGGQPWHGSPVIAGTKPPTSLWLQLLAARPHSFLGALPLAFRRASLFRPDWVGAWVFWALLLLVFAGFPAMLFTLRLALKDDSESSVDERDGT